jgi:hypothetical protein
MAKFIYVGDPNGGPCAAGVVSYKGPAGESVSFPVGQPVEAPEWLASRLAGSNHFKAVGKKAAPAPTPPAPDAPSEPPAG